MVRKSLFLLGMLAALGLLAAAPALAQGGVVWQAEYFNNTFLLGQPAVVRQDSAIAFDWGGGVPQPGVNADGFSVRWGADPFFAAGTYRFFALVDDAVRVNVGYAFTPQIDTWNQPRIGQIVTADITLTEGVHHIQVDYREDGGSAFVYVTWANLASNPNPNPNFPIPQISFASINNGVWTAQYWGNPTLSGSPTLIQSEAFPSHNWGAGSPVVSIPADNFSARWTSVQTLDAGDYTITVRVDDGVRVYVDGNLVIDRWSLANGQTYVANLTLTAGARNFMIEYFEAGGDAFIEYTLARTNVIVPVLTAQPNPPAATGTTITVSAERLNVRDAPNTEGSILLKINRGETYPVVGTNSDRTWWQINVNGSVGWVFGRFVTVSGGQNVTVTSAAVTFAQPAATGYTVTALATVNIRSQPNRSGAILGRLPIRSLANVVGRNASSTWWQIEYQGVVGWVSSRFAQLQRGVDLSAIPVTG